MKPNLVSTALHDHPANVPWGILKAPAQPQLNHWRPLGITRSTHNQNKKYTRFLWCSSPRAWREDAWGWVGEDKVTKWDHCPPATLIVTRLPAYALTHLHHNGPQLHCRHVKCQREAVPALTGLGQAAVTACTSDVGFTAWCCHWS